MKNIFIFIRKHLNLVIFFTLQVVCILLIVQSSRYHRSVFGGLVNGVTGRVNAQYNKVDSYLRLKSTNDSLVKANEGLYQKLKANYDIPDSLSRAFVDTIRVDSLIKYRRFKYLSAKVVANSVQSQANYLILSGANTAGMHAGMGVVDVKNSVVGILSDVSSRDYPAVMSLMHKDARVSARLFKTGEAGTISWGGTTVNEVSLSGIARTVKVAEGDSVVTSGYTTAFPKGLLIGTVIKVENEPSNNNLRITLRTAANFYDIEYAYAIINKEQLRIDSVVNRLKAREQ